MRAAAAPRPVASAGAQLARGWPQCRALQRHASAGNKRCRASADAGAAPDGAVAPQPAAEDSPLSAQLRLWRRSDRLRDGSCVVLRLATAAEGPALTAMLADAFATSMGARQYRKFLGRQVDAYITARLATPPCEAVLLVAAPCGSDGDELRAPSSEPPLLGVVEVSISPRTHGRFDDAAVAPPPHGAFVKNVLSLPSARRRGVAQALLAGVEDFAAAARDAQDALHAAAGTAVPERQHPPPLELFLHCTLGDAPATALYAGMGYATVAQQSALSALRRAAPPLVLMRKRIRP